MVNNVKEIYSVKFIELSNEVHKNKYNYTKSKYENTNTKVIITCPKHGDFYNCHQVIYLGMDVIDVERLVILKNKLNG